MLCHDHTHVVYIVKKVASFQMAQSISGCLVIECMLKLYRPAARKLFVVYVESGTKSAMMIGIGFLHESFICSLLCGCIETTTNAIYKYLWFLNCCNK